MTQTGTLEELNVKPGDVVVYSDGDRHTVEPHKHLYSHQTGRSVNYSGLWNEVPYFTIVSRATAPLQIDTPKTWGEMTDAEKGALLLDDWSDRPLQRLTEIQDEKGNSLCREWDLCDIRDALPSWVIRIKPEPVVETVTIGIANASCGKWYQPGSPGSPATHRITFTTKDGKPDLDSVKMERIND